MAVGKTGAIFKTFTFNGESSKDYGVYITGEAVYNAPERAVEMITIPGRNGAFALDQKRFENIEVTYPAGMFAENEEDFAEGISDLRNMLCSMNGYCRLTDDYNPDEYRLAIYKSGLEVEPWRLRSGEFSITFECQPQRYLLSGDSAVTVANNGTLTNPTLFDAHPLIAAKGYGDLSFNGHTITLNNETYGTVYIYSNEKNDAGIYPLNIANITNNGDQISVVATLSVWFGINGSATVNIIGTAITGQPSKGNMAVGRTRIAGIPLVIANISNIPATFTKGTTSDSTTTGSFTVTTNVNTTTFTVTPHISYSATDDSISLYSTYTIDTTWFAEFNQNTEVQDARVNSTKSILGDPTYIDCDLGEAYMIKNDEYISLDKYLDLGSELPSLAPGSNTVTYDNTYTEVKMTPRWWKV